MKIVLATKNPGKLKELVEIASSSNIDLVLAPADFDPEETGSTFTENAIIKASTAAKMTGLLAVADDSGIVVDALDGRPGIHSARYCPGDDRDRRLKLLDEMKVVPEGRRQAAFVCAMAVCEPDGAVIFTSECTWRGRIAFDERGENGFGFDPIFYMEDADITSAQLSPERKNQLSHRGQAWRQVLAFLEKKFMPR